MRILAQRWAEAAARGFAAGGFAARFAVALAAAIFGLTAIAAFAISGLAGNGADIAAPIVRELPNPELAVLDAGSEAGFAREERVRAGDTLGAVLVRLGVADRAASEFLRTDRATRALHSLRPGQTIVASVDRDGRLLSLRFSGADGSPIVVTRDGAGFAVGAGPASANVAVALARGEIRTSLFAAADAAGMPDTVTMQLAQIFEGEIDFFHDLRPGDRFSVVYEARYADGEPAAAGRVVAALFENRGRTLRAFAWRTASGDAYYAVDGAPLRKAFLRSPLEFSRVTSRFTNARFHPILKTWRAHRGVDFGAPTGTPVRATAEGKVVEMRTEEGYGNVIRLAHRPPYGTLYAHLSRFAAGLRVGAPVTQGQVIGYVGQTGWATGPHLHYEFRVANVQRNPLSVALPDAEPLPAAERPAFAAAIAPAIAKLDLAQALPDARYARAE